MMVKMSATFVRFGLVASNNKNGHKPEDHCWHLNVSDDGVLQ
jgi:hypothetical protein